MVPIIIGFLASVIGLGGIGEKIREIVQTLQKPVNKALDFIIKTGLKLAAPIINAIKRSASWVKGKYEKGKAWTKEKIEKGKAWVKGKVGATRKRLVGKQPDERSPEEKARAVTAALEESEALMSKRLPARELTAALPSIKKQYSLTELRMVVEEQTGMTERVHVEGAASPGRRSRSSKIPTDVKWKFRIPEGPISALKGLSFPRLDEKGDREVDKEGRFKPDRAVHVTEKHVEASDEYLKHRVVGPEEKDVASRFLDPEEMENSLRQAVMTNQDKLRNKLLDERGQPKEVGTAVPIQCRVSGRLGVSYQKATPWYEGAPRRAELVRQPIVGVKVIVLLSHSDPDEGIIYVVPETGYPKDIKRE